MFLSKMMEVGIGKMGKMLKMGLILMIHRRMIKLVMLMMLLKGIINKNCYQLDAFKYEGVEGDGEDRDGPHGTEVEGEGDCRSGPSTSCPCMVSFEDVEVDGNNSKMGRSDILLSPPISDEEDGGIPIYPDVEFHEVDLLNPNLKLK
jgi:uncharacterized membrane protein